MLMLGMFLIGLHGAVLHHQFLSVSFTHTFFTTPGIQGIALLDLALLAGLLMTRWCAKSTGPYPVWSMESAHYRQAQDIIIRSASREMTGQHQCILAYANALEERIARKAACPDLRYDLDDICESSFNLKLIASALHLLNRAPCLKPLRAADTLQQMMLALAPSLERRNMKLSTTGVDLSATTTTDPTILLHVLWMMKLGIIRYAESESTLHIRCAAGSQHTVVSIVISELAPGRLSTEERGEYLTRQIQHLNPHMFAEAIREHANLQLAELLLAPVGGRIEVVPINAYACEICLFLPTA